MTYSQSFAITLDPGDTGLTLKAQVRDVAGAQVGGDITTGFIEVGLGHYTASLTAIPDGQVGTVRILEGATVKGHGALNPQVNENTDVKTSSIDATTDVTAILGDTNEMQGKLPTNNIMGSSVKTDKDDEVDAIKAKTDNLPADPASDTNVDANETKIDTLQTDVTSIKAKTDNLPEGIVRAAAFNLEFFMTDSSDHVTAKLGLVPVVIVSKDGAAFATATNSPATEIANGFYTILLTAAEMTADRVIVLPAATGADDRPLVLLTN